jgi:hypothetical protein
VEWRANDIVLTHRANGAAVATSVELYITAAYWFTASTSFANPAVTIARGFSNTFARIRPADVAPFIVAQLLGAVAAMPVASFEPTNRRPVGQVLARPEEGAMPGLYGTADSDSGHPHRSPTRQWDVRKLCHAEVDRLARSYIGRPS